MSALVETAARQVAGKFPDEVPTVEDVQNVVELTLLGAGEYEAARAYISYRDERSRTRTESVTAEVRARFEADKEYFPTELQEFQFYDKYSRFNWDLMRRETWRETVDRNVDYLRWLSENKLPDADYDRIHEFILGHKTMPSMRSLAMAGEPAKRNALAIYNCSAFPVKDVQAFAEAMRISMAGCGVGFSVERQFVEQFSRVQRQTGEVSQHWVADSADGWADSVELLFNELFAGRDVEMNYDLVRAASTPLMVKGGRASGPAPLKFVHDYVRAKMLSRQGTTLRPIDAYDMMCAVGGAAVSGGVRRTAMICLFDWDDTEMRNCKNGANFDSVRWNANNSAVWPDGLTQVEVVDQLLEMIKGERGEPGIFSRANANRTKPARRAEATFLTNPCGEINLRPFGLCNLTIAVARPDDTPHSLLDKVEVATIIGTIQSLATNFPGMRDEWKQNCEDERLLGVDITGQRDCPLFDVDGETDANHLRVTLKEHVVKTNQHYAELLGINASAATTCDKPSGNSSVFLNTASGIHTRWAPYYLRRTRTSVTTPLFRVLRDAGVPMRPENGQTIDDANTWVVSWPVKAPEGAKTRKDVSVLDQCEFWLSNKLHWTEHNPSVTITYQPHEVLDMINWIWDHVDQIGGMAFLPADDAKYDQAPYEEITETEYKRLAGEFPAIDFSLLSVYEHSDMTTAAQELACLAGVCEV